MQEDLPLSQLPMNREGQRSHAIRDLEAGADYYVQVTLRGVPQGAASCLMGFAPSAVV